MSRPGRRWSPPAWAVVGLAVLAPAVPLVIALLARRHPPWVPDLDLALTELRVRDVGGSHTPLVGLPGRIGTPQRQGSHPGPLGFYLLAPTYRLLGSTVFALQAATVVLHLAGIGATVALVARRAGARWALGVGLGLAVLVSGLGPNLLTEPWNPHLPLLWWPAFLAAAWCALCGQATAAPVLVGAGALCAQSHVSYLAPVGAVTVLALAVCVGWPATGAGSHRWRWLAAALVLGAVLWTPPVVDQARHDPGNARLLVEHLLDPPEAPIGLGDGARLVLERLDVVHLGRAALVDPGRLGDHYPTGASPARGAVLVGVVALAAVAGARRSSRAVRAAQGLAFVALSLAVASAARIFGYPWSYLLLWVWSIAILLALVAAASAPAALASVAALMRWHPGRWARAATVLPLAVPLALGAGAIGVAWRASQLAERAAATNPVVSRAVLALVPPLLERLDPADRYLVTWTDAVHLGGHGYGMVDELERHHVDVAVTADLATQFGRHRTVAGEAADAQLVVATGPAIRRWAVRPGAVEVARVDVRTEAERAEADRTRAALVEVLASADLPDLVPMVDDNLLGVAFDPRLPAAARDLVDRLDALGAPAAVFLVPLGSTLP